MWARHSTAVTVLELELSNVSFRRQLPSDPGQSCVKGKGQAAQRSLALTQVMAVGPLRQGT